jgi:hypothetical protein
MNTRVSVGALCAILLTGCASTPPQNPIDLTGSSIDAKAGRVGVVMTPLPKVDTQFPGAGCLLCLATASLANSALTAHTQTLPYEDLPKLRSEVAEALRKKGTDAIVVADDIKVDGLSEYGKPGPNIARKDFSPLKQKYKIDKLVVIQIDVLGIWRNYSAYVATGDPKAVLKATGYMVNLNNNTYEWYLPLNITKSAEGPWDEAPKFPGLTNAYFQALELGRDKILEPFKKTSTADASTR